MQKTLLLADDSSTIQRVVELTFAQEDIRVIAVADGEQALKSIDREPPDIVLADVGMPRMDGYSVSTHVKSSAALQHIPVLLLAGAFEPVDEARAKAARCDGILVKPFEPRALVTRVQELLDNARAQRAAAAADPGHVAPSPSSADGPAGSERPAALAIDGGDLDRQLAGLTHEPASAVPATSSLLAEPAKAPEPLVLDLGSFTPVHGTEPPMLQARGPEPLELAPMPIGATPAPEPTPAAPAALEPAPVAAPSAASAASTVSLSSAFSALLAAERSAPAGAAVPALNEQALEDVVRRVLLNDNAIRKLVLDAAERMVKEEIERITSASETAEGEPGTE